MQPITFVTSNKSKAEQLARYLDFPVQHHKLDLPEIQSLDLEEIVRNKAQAAYQVLQSPVLVEDVALTFSALGKLPGPLIKWFLGELGNQGLCDLLKDKSRQAQAQVLFCLFDGQSFRLFKGEKSGSIAKSPRGATDFGWNPIFIPDGYSKTWAEMNIEDQNKTSMRKIALQELQAFLTAI